MRIEMTNAEDRARAGPPIPHDEPPRNGLPEDFREHARLMCDIIALAFQTDKTRIASLFWPATVVPLLSVPRRPRSPSQRLAQRHLRRLRKDRPLPPEPTGLLRQKFGNARRRRHRARQLLPDVHLQHVFRHPSRQHKSPVVTVGGLGGTLQTGRSLDYFNAGDNNRKLCSLYLGIMDRMGVQLDHFGDATTRLDGF